MKRIRFILGLLRRATSHTICALTCFVLIATVCAWMQSYWSPHALSYIWREPAPPYDSFHMYDFTETYWSILSCSGGLKFQLQRHEDPTCWHDGFEWDAFLRGSQFGRYPSVSIDQRHIPPAVIGLDWIGASYFHERQLQIIVVVPHGVVALAAAVLPWLWLRRFRQLRPVNAGLCPKCRYDLRAHKPGDKCPECGTAVTASTNPSPTTIPP